MATTTELTQDYISKNRSIRECLKKGLINYSALSRLIKSGAGKQKKVTKEGILIAARRYKDKIKSSYSVDVKSLLKSSNIEIKNNVVVFTLEKNIYPDVLIEIEKKIKKGKDLFFSIEGTKTITVIVQKNNAESLLKKFRISTLNKKESLSLITLTRTGIGGIPGAVNYISGLFFENNINIEEFMSCHDDTLIVIKSEDVEKIMKFLNF